MESKSSLSMESTSTDNDPVRRSRRQRKPTAAPVIVKMQKSKKHSIWTKQEKTLLLAGLKRVGERDFVGLSKFVPTKRPGQIAYYINCLKQKLPAYMQSNRRDHGDYWVQHLSQLTSRTDRLPFDPLSISFLLISLFESHPPPTRNGIDFKTLYEYLFCEMAEVQRPPISKSTKSFLYKSLQDIQSISEEIKTDVIESLKNATPPTEWPFNSSAMNPLKFPKVDFEMSK